MLKININHLFLYSIVRIRERGVLSRIKRKWVPQPLADCASDGDVKRISVNQVEGAFTALFVTIMIVCPVIYVGEKCFSLLRNYFNKENNEITMDSNSG